MIGVLTKFQTSISLSMNQLWFIILLIIFMISQDEAQAVSSNYGSNMPSDLKPSIAIVIGILCVMFVLTFVLLVYAKLCHRSEPVLENLQNQQGLISRSSRFSGIDKTVIESLPFFRFSSLKGSKEGLECAVCLSKFEDFEVLRLLPKCKHAFHIDCIDHWLEKHSSCPLCRHRVSSEDLTIIAYSNSMRFLGNNQSELREDSNIELFVQREEGHRGSSRFSIGSSFRQMEKGDKEEELLIQEEEVDENNEDQKVFHKHNHKIIVSDFMFKNRWSSVSSSDLLFLNSEMINHVSSNRFSTMDSNNELFLTRRGSENEEIMKIKEEMEMKRSFESKVSTINKNSGSVSIQVLDPPSDLASSSKTSRAVNQGEKRSMSEITALSRYGNFDMSNRIGESHLSRNSVKEESIRRLWLPIARRTVQWFANREKRSQLSQKTRQQLDV